MATLQPSSKNQQQILSVIGPRLRILLRGVLVGFGLLCVNSVYLLTITSLERIAQHSYQGPFYLWMFLAHLALGMLFIVPAVIFAGLHVRNAYQRPNRRAVRAGVGLFGALLFLLLSGLVLTQYSVFEVRSPTVRSLAYWIHVLSPLLVIWLFVLHRLAGPRIQWALGLGWRGGSRRGGCHWLAASRTDK